MDLSPAEIANKQFSQALRGYEKHEVDAFLAEIAARLEEVERQPRTPVTGRPTFDQLGQEVGAVLETAKRSADTMRIRAQQEADALRRSASEAAALMRQQAQDEAEATRRSAEEAAERLTVQTEARCAQLRAAAERDAREMKAAAENDARETRAQAEQESRELLDEAIRRHDVLRTQESELRERVGDVERALETLRGALDREGTPDLDEVAVPTFATGGVDFDAGFLPRVDESFEPAGLGDEGALSLDDTSFAGGTGTTTFADDEVAPAGSTVSAPFDQGGTELADDLGATGVHEVAFDEEEALEETPAEEQAADAEVGSFWSSDEAPSATEGAEAGSDEAGASGVWTEGESEPETDVAVDDRAEIAADEMPAPPVSLEEEPETDPGTRLGWIRSWGRGESSRAPEDT